MNSTLKYSENNDFLGYFFVLSRKNAVFCDFFILYLISMIFVFSILRKIYHSSYLFGKEPRKSSHKLSVSYEKETSTQVKNRSLKGKYAIK